MSRRYRIREEVNAIGESKFYIDYKDGWFLSFWKPMKKFDDAWSMYVSIRLPTLEQAQKKIKTLKAKDERHARYIKESEIVETRYYGEEDV